MKGQRHPAPMTRNRPVTRKMRTRKNGKGETYNQRLDRVSTMRVRGRHWRARNRNALNAKMGNTNGAASPQAVRANPTKSAMGGNTNGAAMPQAIRATPTK